MSKEEITLKINNTNKYKVTFVSMTHDAKGVAKLTGINDQGVLLENFPVFVRNVIVGEEGLIKLETIKRTYATGTLVKLFLDKASSLRATPICQHYSSCGGCMLMHMTYQGQLLLKKSLIVNTFNRIGKFEDIKVQNVIGMDHPYQYRNKVQIPFGFKNQKTVCGFFQEGTHNIIPIEKCYLQSDEITEIAKFIRNLCNEYRIKGYDEVKDRGDLRHILVRESYYSQEIMVVLITTKDRYYNLEEFVDKLVKRHPRISSVILNVNPLKTNVILGKTSKLLYGKPTITDQILGNKFTISDRSFFQVNTLQTERLYQGIIDLAGFNKEDVVIDAYCGIGSIGICIAKMVTKVYGVEVIEVAIKDAKLNAKNNQINNIEFVCNKAEDQIVKWYQQGIKPNAIIVDPPRKGCDQVLLETIVKMEIPKIVYVSCDCATLARDCRYLVDNDYQIKIIQPVDLFPQTNHVENIVVLKKLKS